MTWQCNGMHAVFKYFSFSFFKRNFHLSLNMTSNVLNRHHIHCVRKSRFVGNIIKEKIIQTWLLMCSNYLTKSSTNNLNYFGSISEGNWLFGTSLMVILPIYVKLNLKAWLQPLKGKKMKLNFICIQMIF